MSTPTPVKRHTENTATEEPSTDFPSTENTAIIQEGVTKQELQIKSTLDIDTDIEIFETKPVYEKTPREIAKEFFDMDEKELFVSLAIDKENLKLQHEIREFRNYWKELTLNGKKQRWEKESTFEIKKRLARWFHNAKVFYKPQNDE